MNATSGIVSRFTQTTEAYAKSELVELFRAAGFSQVEVLPHSTGTPENAGLCCVLATG